jgi:hypothetical protein
MALSVAYLTYLCWPIPYSHFGEHYVPRAVLHVLVSLIESGLYIFRRTELRRLRSLGFLILWDQLSSASQLPISVLSVGNGLVAVMLGMATIDPPADPTAHPDIDSFVAYWDAHRLTYLQFIVSAELAFICVPMLVFTSRARHHNRASALPDTSMPAMSGSGAEGPIHALAGTTSTTIIARQGELIRHLRQQQRCLSQQLVARDARLAAFQRTDTPRASHVDQAEFETQKEALTQAKQAIAARDAALMQHSAARATSLQEAAAMRARVDRAERRAARLSVLLQLAGGRDDEIDNI